MTAYARPTFPGLRKIVSCSVTIGHGVIPTGFRLLVAPQPPGEVVEQGVFGLEYNNTRLEFPECRIDRAQFRFDLSGQLIDLTIVDRRWKWALAYNDGDKVFGRISGEYNIRREDGTIKKIEGGNPDLAVEDSERTPQQLAELLLKAAGEWLGTYQVNALPTDVRPYVAWDASNPMFELNRLCELLGCRVVLDHVDNTAKVVKLNQGRILPTGKITQYGAGANYNDTPEQVDVVTAPIAYQHDFELEPMAIELSGDLVPLDDVSYKPDDGWKDLDVYSNAGELDDAAKRNLANRSVYRIYRIKAPFTLPQFGQVTRREQIVLLGQQVFKENIDGVRTPRAALVYGKWFIGDDAVADNSIEKFKYLPDESIDADPEQDEKALMVVTTGFRIDPERWLVIFSQPIYQENDDGEFEPATLRLRTTCYIRDPKTGGIQRMRRARKITNAAKPYSLDLRHDEIKPTVWSKYSDSFFPTEIFTNGAEIDREIEHYLDEAVLEFGSAKIPQSAEYGGWRFDLPLDGAIQAITWTLDAKGGAPTTQIDRCHDSGQSGLPYKTLNAYQKMARAERISAQQEFINTQIALLNRGGDF